MKFQLPDYLGDLYLKNRIIRAGCYEGLSREGNITDALIDHHRKVAKGGVAMTTLSYCSVSYDGRAFDDEIWIKEEILPQLKKFTRTIHNENAKASIQLGHCGYFTSKKVVRKRPLGASAKMCLYTLSRCRKMTKSDIEEKINDFINAALLVKKAGFDTIEIHAGHGYLLSQFISPWTNKRKDEYGGSLENRLRFPVAVISGIRKAVGPGFPILVKMNQWDGMPGGIEIEDSIKAAMAFEEAGASALIPSAGFTSKVPFLMLRGKLPVKEMSDNQERFINRIGLKLFGRFMVPEHPYHSLFLLEGAKQIKKAANIPVIYIGGVDSVIGMNRIMDEGFEFIQIGRASIQDPDFVNKINRGELKQSPCDHCNRCVAAMDGGGVYCVSNELGFI